MRKKVFVLGLDGASFNVLDPLMERGNMPNLAKVINDGVKARLVSTYPPTTPAAWVSFMTGKNPGKHGVYGWAQQVKGEYDTRPADTKSFRRDTLWAYLSDYDRTVGVINVPMTYPPQNVNGFVVAGMDTPSEKKCTYPDGLYQDLLKNIGDYVIEIDWNKYPDKSKAEFLKDLVYSTKKRLEATLYLMGKFDWDFFISVFIGTDRIQHFLWDYVERAVQGSVEGPVENEILRYYKLVDESIAEIIDRIDNKTCLIIMSDHGFKRCDKTINWNRWFIENGYLSLNEKKEKSLNAILPFFHGLGMNRKRIRSVLTALGITNRRTLNKLSLFSKTFGIVNWKETKAFANVNSNIRINTRGREPDGIVNPGTEYKNLVSELMGRIKKLKDPETGMKAVREVFTPDQIYSGEYLEFAPDIVVDLQGTPYDDFSDTINVPNVFLKTQAERRGNHDMEGIFVGYGNGFRKGTEVNAIKILDLFPTILYLMGLPVPRDVDGRIAREIISEEFDAELPIEIAGLKKENVDITKDMDRSPEEDRIIEERLKDLGYMD
jgi:predicted AlkP superfamily phosphohydrolase/phosphomutase